MQVKNKEEAVRQMAPCCALSWREPFGLSVACRASQGHCPAPPLVAMTPSLTIMNQRTLMSKLENSTGSGAPDQS